MVLALAALLTVLVPVAFDRLREGANYRETLRSILSDVRVARQRALTEGREIQFAVDLGQRTYGIVGAGLRELPEPLQIRATVGSVGVDSGEAMAIRFLPTGGATGGSIDILRPAGGGTRVTVDWLSGAASHERVDP